MNLTERIANHLAELPPHVRYRKTASLLADALAQLLAVKDAHERAMTILAEAERGRIEAAEREANTDPA